MISIIQFITQAQNNLNIDIIIFWGFQIFLVYFFLLALFKYKRFSFAKIIRGDTSFNYLVLFFIISTSVIILGIISIPEIANGYKLYIFLVDILICFYLCFLNGWSKNKLIGWRQKLQKTEE